MKTHHGDGWVYRALNGEALSEIERTTISNTETPTPTTVGYYRRDYAPPYDYATENAAIYTRIDHRPGQTDFRYWLYAELTEQSIVGGSITKVIHRGAGDAHYVAMLGNNTSGYGYEAAMFGGWQDPPTNSIPKQENGFISTFQGSGGFQESIKNQGNSVCYQALVHDDGVDPTSPTPWATNYGLFYANNSLSNAFVVRRSQYALNYSQFKLMDHTANQRPIWQVFSEGDQWMNGEEATALSTLKPSPPLSLRGYYWTGSAEQANHTQLSHQTGGAGGGVFRVDIGNPGSEVLALQVSEAGDGTFSNLVRVNNGSTFRDTANGSPQFATSDGTGFVQLNLGPATSLFPMLKRSSTTVLFRTGDDTAYTNILINRLDTVQNIVCGSSLRIASTSHLFWNARGAMWSPDANTINFRNIADTAWIDIGMRDLKADRGLGVFAVTPPTTQPSHIADPSGGTTIDAEARTAIAAINARLELYGLSATV